MSVKKDNVFCIAEESVETELTMIKLKDSLSEVRYGLESILQLDGVNKDLALTLEHIIPDSLPINSFTKEPTHTNVDIVKISLENRLKKVFDAMIEMIKKLFKKIMEWLGLNKGAEKHEEAKKEHEEAVDDAKKDVQELKAITKAPIEEVEELDPKLTEPFDWSLLDNAFFFSDSRELEDFLNLNRLMESEILDEADEGLLNIIDMMQNDYIVGDMFEGIKRVTTDAIKRNRTFSKVLKERYVKAGTSENVFHLGVLAKEMKTVIEELMNTPYKEDYTPLDLLIKYDEQRNDLSKDLEEKLLSHSNESFKTRVKDLESRLMTLWEYKKDLEKRSDKYGDTVYGLQLDSGLLDIQRIVSSVSIYLSIKDKIVNAYIRNYERFNELYSLVKK
jgi:hypothetical protein